MFLNQKCIDSSKLRAEIPIIHAFCVFKNLSIDISFTLFGD